MIQNLKKNSLNGVALFDHLVSPLELLGQIGEIL